ncbi:hypothetical protein FB565_004836 [Actinoplanes lutulentus]|uniref:Uncharacterized protein DUF397 n=1 Tax=Actinoplanes lutulentus TaxID=1287878 RepID=A0A327Z5Y3_9ACTN|nr:DUF397 domain-containing protein [Actinoplanes lutulentus]MBB2945103.1 hypothetical protein [Actinoplanes lutulentus]RAK31899.1 uncharacterized protein DUF397 [Actinoplanes lutulentus]
MIKKAEGPRWRRSRQCASGACVEVAKAGDEVLIRDSKNRHVTPLAFSRAEWDAFVAGVKAGDFGFE